MDFFHVSSFEDHFTLKIWVKNWNLKVNRHLFKFIHDLNYLFNSEITQDIISKHIDIEILENIFHQKIWNQEPLKFQLFIKKDLDDQKQIQGQFFKKMNFLFFLVEIDNQESSQIQDLHNKIKKFAFLQDNISILIIFFCSDENKKNELYKFQNSIILQNTLLTKENFQQHIVPIFLDLLKEKFQQTPKLEEDFEKANKSFIANSNSDMHLGINEGKVFKLRGDMSLIFDALEDGYDYYEKALIIFDQKNLNPIQNSDKLTIWQGTIKESQAALTYYQIKQALKRNDNQIDEEIEILQKQLVQQCNQALKLYLKESKKDFILELLLKLLGLFSLLKNKQQFMEKFFQLKNLDKTLNIDPRIYLYIGDLAHNTNLDRMALCSLFECTRKSEQIESLKTITNECLNLSAKILKIDLDSYQNDYQMLELLPKQITQAFLQKLMNLNQILGNTEKTLHYYLLIIKKFEDKEDYYKKITEQILWEVPFYNHQYDILPYVQRIEPIGREKDFRKILINENSSKQIIEQSVFIYDPRNKNKFIDLNWVAQQESEIRVFITNPIENYIKIDSLSLETEIIDTANYSTEYTLTPYQKNFECKFKMRPVNQGIMKIKGIKIRIGNLIYFNEVDSRGVGTLYKCLKKDNPYIYQKFYEQYDINLDKVEIAESVPLIQIEPNNYLPETLFYNENIFLDLKITNFSKQTAQDFVAVLKVDYENGAPVKINQEFKNLELDYSKNFCVGLQLFQGEGGQNNQEIKLQCQQKDNNFQLVFSNKNLIERIYKVTLSFESKFNNNKNFVSCKKFIKSFKNYKLFDVTLNLIDLFGVSDLRIKDDWKLSDISDQLQFYFEIKTQFSNICTSNITIFLRNKITKQNLQSIVLSEKNVIKFSESRKQLLSIKNLNEKYELYWQISENQRSGIIYFSYPLVFQSFFQLQFDYQKNVNINEPIDLIIKGDEKNQQNGFVEKEFFCSVSLASKKQSKQFIQGKTKFWFKNSFKKNFKLIFCDKDEYHLYLIIKNYKNKHAMIHREIINV